jgi:hypothetical protein
MPNLSVVIQNASEIDYAEYAAFQRAAYRDLLDRTRATDAHMTPDFYRWKYHTPDGMARVASVTQGEVTLSSSAVMPLRVGCRGGSVIGWHCVDVATLPEARRKGHFLTTLRAVTETVPSGDVLFAFPNSGSIVSFLKLGCTENRILTTWINPFVRLIRRRCEHIEEVDGFDAEHAIVGDRVSFAGPFVDRRPDYLNWRYTDHPSNRYVSFVYRGDGVEGLCIVRRARVMGRNLALVMEVLGSNPRVQSALLCHAAGWASAERISMMALMSTMLPLSTASRTLFVPVPSILLPKRQVLVVKGAGKLPAALARLKWVLQTGDWDVF